MYHYQPSIRNGLPGRGHHLIKVTGEGEIAAQPDSASVNLGVITESKELLEGQQQNSLASTKVINSLVSLGISQKNIQTLDYRIESNYDYVEGKQIFRGYKITHILQVILDDLTIVGKAVDTAVQNGANYVAAIQFTVKNKDFHYQQALALALTNAIQKAKTIAGTLNVNLMPTPTQVVEGGHTIQPFYQQTEMMAKGFSAVQIEPGQIIVKAAITAEFHYH